MKSFVKVNNYIECFGIQKSPLARFEIKENTIIVQEFCNKEACWYKTIVNQINIEYSDKATVHYANNLINHKTKNYNSYTNWFDLLTNPELQLLYL